MTNALGAKPVVDTSDFKSGITRMNADLRVLESGFRANTASMGDWARTGTGLEARIKSLNSQMDVQRQKVAALKGEYERIKLEKGADAAATKNAEVAYHKSVETLGKMQSELRNTKTALVEVKKHTEESGKAAEQAKERWESLKGALGGIASTARAALGMMIGLGAGVAVVAAALGGMVFASASAAAGLVDMSEKTGISTTRLQELQFFGSQYKLTLDMISSSQSKLTRSMSAAQAGTGDAADAFKALGVDVADAEGNLRDQQDVFAEVIDALGQIENPAERDALAMKLFGKSAQELNPLIKAGSEEMARLSEEAHRVGAVISEEDVAALEAFDDTLEGWKLGLKGMLGSLAVGFIPGFTKVFDKLGELGTRFAPILQYVVDNVAVPAITKLTDGFIALLDNIDFSKIIEDVVAFSKFWDEVMKGTFDVGQWLKDMNWGDVSTKIIEAIEKVDWNTVGINLGNWLREAWGVAKESASEFDWGGVLKSLGSALADFTLGVGGFTPESWTQLWDSIKAQIQASVDAYGPIGATVKFLVELNAELGGDFATQFANQIVTFIGLAIKSTIKLQIAAGRSIVEGLWEGIKGAAVWLEGKIKEFIEGIIEAILKAEDSNSPAKKFMPAGRFAVMGYEAGMMNEFAGMQQRLGQAFGSLALSPAFTAAGGGGGTVVNNNGGNTSTNFSINGLSMPNMGPQTTMADIMEFLNRRS